jgi:hypothetical protein
MSRFLYVPAAHVPFETNPIRPKFVVGILKSLVSKY